MRLSLIERKWFASRVPGQSGTTPLNDIKRRYYVSQLGSVPSVNSLTDLEKRWLRATITANGKTPTGDSLADLWTQLVASAGLRVSKRIDENRQTYFLNT